jgi:hypothetical protein
VNGRNRLTADEELIAADASTTRLENKELNNHRIDLGDYAGILSTDVF